MLFRTARVTNERLLLLAVSWRRSLTEPLRPAVSIQSLTARSNCLLCKNAQRLDQVRRLTNTGSNVRDAPVRKSPF